MRYVSLFSGIEAATVAWEPLGWEPVAFSEIDKFPCAVLEHRYPNIPNLGDVSNADWSEYSGAADVVVGGFPCQSYSLAGLRRGLDDPRGGLMLEFLRACREIDPDWIVGENVAGLLSANGGNDFQTFLEAVALLWPRGGSLGGFSTLRASEYPNSGAASSLSSILETGEGVRKYCLSQKACAGILKRTRKKGKRLPEDMEEALERRASHTASA